MRRQLYNFWHIFQTCFSFVSETFPPLRNLAFVMIQRVVGLLTPKSPFKYPLAVNFETIERITMLEYGYSLLALRLVRPSKAFPNH